MSFDTYNVVILGPSGAGKTVYLGSLFKQLSTQGEKGFFLNVLDPKQKLLLNTVYTQIITGDQWPLGTRSLSNWEFDCCVKNANLDNYPVFKFSYIDYGGGLLTDGTMDEDENFSETLQAADAVLVLIDGSKILRFMRNQPGSDVAIWVHRDIPGTMQQLNLYNKRIPIQFIISKWDLLESQFTLTEIVEQLMKITEFHNVVEQRKNAGCPLRLIPISSVGSDFATLQPDGSMKKNLSVIPKPFQVEIPLFCILIDRIKSHSSELTRKQASRDQPAPDPDARTHRFEFLQHLINSITGQPTPGIQASSSGNCWQKINDESAAINYIVGVFVKQLRQFELRFPDSKLTEESILSDVVDSGVSREVAGGQTQPSSAINHFKLYRNLQGHAMAVRSVRFTHENNDIIGCGVDNKIIFWERDSGKIMKVLAETANFVLAEMSLNGEMLITATGDHNIKIRDAHTHKILIRWKAHNDIINAIRVSPDLNTILSCSRDQTIKIWSPGSRSSQLLHTLRGHQGIVYDISVAADWLTLASAGSDKTVLLWNLEDGTIRDRLGGYPGYLRAVAFSPDGKMLAYGGQGNEVYLWDCTRKQLIYTLSKHSESISSLAFHQQATILASGGEDSDIHLWDTTTGGHITVLKGHTSRINSLAFSHDSSLLASGSNDRTVNLWTLS
jgi:hypothetical protein